MGSEEGSLVDFEDLLHGLQELDVLLGEVLAEELFQPIERGSCDPADQLILLAEVAFPLVQLRARLLLNLDGDLGALRSRVHLLVIFFN